MESMFLHSTLKNKDIVIDDVVILFEDDQVFCDNIYLEKERKTDEIKRVLREDPRKEI